MKLRREGTPAASACSSSGGWCENRRRESLGLDEAGHGARFMPSVACCLPLSAQPPLPLVQSKQKAVGIKEEKTGNITQRDKTRVEGGRLMTKAERVK